VLLLLLLPMGLSWCLLQCQSQAAMPAALKAKRQHHLMQLLLLVEQLQLLREHQQTVPAAVAESALMAMMLHCWTGSFLAHLLLPYPAAAVAQLLLPDQLSFAAAVPHLLLLLWTDSSSYQATHLEPLLLHLAARLLNLLQLQQA
jgi:hypothetical protein